MRPLEKPLPSLEQILELFASVAMSFERVDVVPVFGQAPLELADGVLVCGDLGFDALEL